MPTVEKGLGRLISTHATAPAYMQRAALIAVLSFIFFLAMLAAFYARQHIGYFALSTAFLVVYILTMVSWVLQRRTVVSIYENGLRYKKFQSSWDDIKSVKADSSGLEITKGRHERTRIPASVLGYEAIVRTIQTHLERTSAR